MVSVLPRLETVNLRLDASRRVIRSAPFNILDIGRVHVTLRKPAQEGHRSHRELIRVEVLINGPSIFIQLSKETDPWPFRIQNNTDAEIEFCQTVGLASYELDAPIMMLTSLSVCSFVLSGCLPLK